MDDVLIGHATSTKRPVSLYLGNPIVLEDWGGWTKLEVDYVRTDRCAEWYWPTVRLPLVFKGWNAPVPTITPMPTIPTATASPVPTIPTPTATPQPMIEITALEYLSQGEYVEISNRGEQNQPMADWRLVSLRGEQSYEFPEDFVLEAGATVMVHSGPDAFDNPPTDLLWCRSYVWHNEGDTAVLYDDLCREVSRWAY